MDNNLLNDDIIECKKCKGKKFYLNNDSPVCEGCGLYLSNNSKYAFNDKTKNKVIHLKNVIKNMETENVSQINELVKCLHHDILDEKINPDFIDSTYICEVLKKNGKKSYILDIQVYNKYINNNSRLSNKDKTSIKIIFYEFFKYAAKHNPQICKNSISYHQVLYNIYKYLAINIHIKPSLTRNKNEDLNIVFEEFLNNLCEEFIKDNSDNGNTTSIIKYKEGPEINNYPNIFYIDTE